MELPDKNRRASDLDVTDLPSFEELTERFHREAVAKRVFRKGARLSLISGDLAIVAGSIYLWASSYVPADKITYTGTLLTAVILPVFLLLTTVFKGYHFSSRPGRGVPVALPLAALLISIAGVLLFIFLTRDGAISRVVIVGSTFTSLVGLLIFRIAISVAVSRNLQAGQFATLCIYDGQPVELRDKAHQLDAESFGLSADASNPEMIRRLAEISRDFDCLVIHCIPSRRQSWIKVLRSLSIPSEIIIPELNEIAPIGLKYRVGGASAIISAGPLQLNERIQKRAFDLAVVGMSLPILVPLFAIVALAIKLDSPGPVFFLQDRIGRDNRPFKIFKFRSMAHDKLDHDGAKSTLRNDARITRLGRILRKTSIDELPQLINVLRGDMSLVGPRPHARFSRAGDRLFWEVDNSYWLRHSVKPGITGLAQIRGFRGNTFEERHLRNRLNADLEYLANWSLLKDLKILFQTLRVLSHTNAF